MNIAALTVTALRGGVGLGFTASPGKAARAFGDRAEPPIGQIVLGRLFGIRNIAIAVAPWVAPARSRRRWFLLCAAVDAADAATAYLAVPAGEVSRLPPAAARPALAAVALGLWASLRT